MAQVGPPRMLVPIALGLSWPDRLPNVDVPTDWSVAQSWQFLPLDDEAFPAVALARRAGSTGGTGPAVYNAANEVCVDAFCAGRLEFPGIVDVVADVVATHLARHAAEPLSLAAVLAADQWARQAAAERISKE